MSTSRKPPGLRSKKRDTKRRKRPAAKAHRNETPDLEPIMHAFWDAEALVSVASKVVMDSLYAGPESAVLRLGVEALEKVSDQLDAANTALTRFLKKHGVVKGGAS